MTNLEKCTTCPHRVTSELGKHLCVKARANGKSLTDFERLIACVHTIERDTIDKFADMLMEVAGKNTPLEGYYCVRPSEILETKIKLMKELGL